MVFKKSKTNGFVYHITYIKESWLINTEITPHLKKLVNSLVREVNLKVPPESKIANINF